MSDYPNFDDDKEMIGWLEKQGAIIWDGLAENGEPIFRFNMDKLKIVLPELYQVLMEEIDEDLLTLYKEGFVEVEYNENLEAHFKLSEKGQRMAEELGGPHPFPF